MTSSHDRAAKLVAKKLKGRYNRATSPDVKGKLGRAEVKTSASEIPKALQQLAGGTAPAYIVLPKSEHKEALRRSAHLKTGLMNYRGNIVKKSNRR